MRFFPKETKTTASALLGNSRPSLRTLIQTLANIWKSHECDTQLVGYGKVMYMSLWHCIGWLLIKPEKNWRMKDRSSKVLPSCSGGTLSMTYLIYNWETTMVRSLVVIPWYLLVFQHDNLNQESWKKSLGFFNLNGWWWQEQICDFFYRWRSSNVNSFITYYYYYYFNKKWMNYQKFIIRKEKKRCKIN